MKDIRMLRARRVANSALRAYEQGATADQLAEFLMEIDQMLAMTDEALDAEGGGSHGHETETRSDVGAEAGPHRVEERG